MEMNALFNELTSDLGSSSRREDYSGGSQAVVVSEGKDAVGRGEQKGDAVAVDEVERVPAKAEPAMDAAKEV